MLPATVGNLIRVQVGPALPFAREQASGINKSAVTTPIVVDSTGLADDEQADTFFHGAADQAVHQMPTRVYDLLREHYPHLALYEGMLGENIIVENMHEGNVCVGDIYQIGDVQLQVTRPRRPCWKIDTQLGQSGIAKFLHERGQVGWYYAVRQAGTFQVGQPCTLLERPYPYATLEQLWEVCNDKSYDSLAILDPWLSIEPLEQSFKAVIRKRIRDTD